LFGEGIRVSKKAKAKSIRQHQLTSASNLMERKAGQSFALLLFKASLFKKLFFHICNMKMAICNFFINK